MLKLWQVIAFSVELSVYGILHVFVFCICLSMLPFFLD